jgi:hypothetical protein
VDCSISQRSPTVFNDLEDIASVDPSFRTGMEFLTATNDSPEGFWRLCDEWVLLGVKVAHEEQSAVWFVRLSVLPPRVGADGEPLAAHPTIHDPLKWS